MEAYKKALEINRTPLFTINDNSSYNAHLSNKTIAQLSPQLRLAADPYRFRLSKV